MMKRLLVIASLLACLLGYVLAVVFESYMYPGFLKHNLLVPFRLIVYLTLGLGAVVSLYAAASYKSEFAKGIFSFALLVSYLFFWIAIVLNQELIAVSEGNSEILYGWYHIDIRVIQHAQRLILPFFAVVAVLFFQDIVPLAKDILKIMGFLTGRVISLILATWRYLRIPRHRDRILNLFRYWDITLFAFSMLLFWHQQVIFSSSFTEQELGAMLRILGGYTALGMVFTQGQRVSVALIGSIVIWVLIGFFHFREIFILPWALLLSFLAALVIMSLYIVGRKGK